MPITKLNLWVQSVLPTVYDDSLSYLEFLGRVQAKLNEIIDSDAETRQIVDAFIEQFDTDLNTTVATYLDAWLADGTIMVILQSALDDFNASVQPFKDEITTARGASASLDARLDAMDTNTTNVTNEVTTSRGTALNLNARIADNEALFTALKAEVETARGASANLDTRLDAGDTALANQVSAFNTLLTEITNARNGQANLDTRLDALDVKTNNVIVGANGKRYKIIACVLRNTAGTWGILNDAGHAPVGVTSVTADATSIILTYDFTSAKIGSLVCCPDETYNADGVQFGASVGDTTATIKPSIHKEVGGYIFYNGTTWDISLCKGIVSAVWETDKLRVTHSNIYQANNYLSSLSGRGGALTPVYSTATGALGTTDLLIEFYDWAGVKQTTQSTNMKFFINRRSEGLVDPALLTQASANIWVYGVFEIA